MNIAKHIRIHRFHDLISFYTDETSSQYLSVEQAKALHTELGRFIRNIENDGNQKWVATRIIDEKGKAVSESTGQKKVEFVY